MKKLSSLFMLLCASVMTFAAETLVASCDFTTKAVGHAAYGDTWQYGDWSVFGGANNNKGWTFVKFGGKSTALANANPCYVFGQVAGKKVTKIVVTTNAGNLTNGSVNEWGVNVYSDAQKHELVEKVTGAAMTQKVAETLTLLPTEDGKWAADSYYEVFFDLANTTDKNGIVWIEKIEFFTEGGGEPIAVTGITLDQTELTLSAGKTETLTATVEPANADNKNVTWSTSAADVATVENGVVTAVAQGEATITATTEDGSFTATCALTVTEPLPMVEYALLPLEDIIAADEVIVTWKKEDKVYAVTNTNGATAAPKAIEMTLTDGKILTDNKEVVWNVTEEEDGYLIKPVGDAEKWLYTIAANNGIRVGSGDNKYFNLDEETGYLVVNDGSDLRYVGIYNNADLRSYTSVHSNIKDQTLAFYVKQNGPRPRKLSGAYTVGGENADYASLAAACADIDTSKVVGDISLLICADLEEPKNMGIKNASKYTVTITVDQATARKVTFTQAGDNAGPSGNICIGCDMTLTHAGATSLTRNVVIDGSYEGDGERWLTLETAQGVNKYNGPVLIYGNVKDCAVRNTKLIVLNSGSSNYGVVVRTQTGSALAPERITIENNYIQNLGGTSGQGVYFQRASSCTANPSDVSILNNEFVVATRGIFMAANSGTTTIKGNTFSVRQTATGMFSYGIFGNANIEGTIEIAENKFIELTTAASGENYGIAAIGVGVGGDWTIVNNYITGFNPTSVTTDVQLKGIVSAKVGSVNIAHNTIVLNQLLNAPSAAAEDHIVMLDAREATSVKNNLVVSYETTALNALVKNASEVCANNIYYTDETAANAYVATTAKTLADYQATEPTAKLIAVNFTDVAAGDLSLTGASVGNQSLGVERLEEVPTDIMGTTRASLTYAGAFEASDLTDLGSSVEALTLNGVWYANGVVYNTANVLLHVYNVNGMLVASGTNNINMNGHADGLYIVRSAEGALKFVK